MPDSVAALSAKFGTGEILLCAFVIANVFFIR